jgi:DNA-directed RNA polymerase subunit K/omega
MKVFTPGQLAARTGSKYEGVMVAAAYARKLNELPKVGGKEWKKKYTTRAVEELVDDRLTYEIKSKQKRLG